MNNYANMRDTYIIDEKIGDVNGDKIPDTVYLVGEKRENPFYENIRIIVRDGRTRRCYVIPLYAEYSMAYSPWLFLGSFTKSHINEIMVSLPVGGSGALTYYYVISFLKNKAEYILEPEDFIALIELLKVEVIYRDHYKVLIKSLKLKQSYMLDINSRREIYEGTVYNKNGQLIAPKQGFLIYQPRLDPIRFSGDQPYRLGAQQEIAGTSRADRLGYMVTYWQYSGHNRSWVLDPHMFSVML